MKVKTKIKAGIGLLPIRFIKAHDEQEDVGKDEHY